MKEPIGRVIATEKVPPTMDKLRFGQMRTLNFMLLIL